MLRVLGLVDEPTSFTDLVSADKFNKVEPMRRNETMFGNWGPMNPIVFGANKGQLAFYEAHAKDLDNVQHLSHWRNKMTPEHELMRRSSANRSHAWIPHEILEGRDELLSEWCKLILMEGDYDAVTRGVTPSHWTWNDDRLCCHCGWTKEKVKERLDAENPSGVWHSPGLYLGWCNFCREEMLEIVANLTLQIKEMAKI
tara:strand:+ start:316 stop:912 length:597 start_codon:yes stop_codon:yes gene_type:complete